MGVRLINNGKPDASLEFSTGYMDQAFRDPSQVIEEARTALRGVKYDTLVGTGMSGAVIVPTLARALRKKFLIVRKDVDLKSSHASLQWLGELGKRWLFVDDFVSTGDTYARVRRAVEKASQHYQSAGYGSEPFETEHVGSYMYNGWGDHRGFTRWEESERVDAPLELEVPC